MLLCFGRWCNGNTLAERRESSRVRFPTAKGHQFSKYVPFGGKKSERGPKIITEDKIYKYHVENLRSIVIAINNTAISARKAIAEENSLATQSFVRLYAFLVGAWAEVRLKKLLFERSAFTPDERKRISDIPAKCDQWLKTIEIAFRKHYNVPHAPLKPPAIPFAASSQFGSLLQIIDSDLRLVIEVRNKLAHGQWIYPFNNDDSDIESEKYRLINKENMLSLQFKLNLVGKLTDIIHDLVVSRATFERDFDKHYKDIEMTRMNLQTRDYAVYQDNLVEKRKRGIQKRKKIT